MFDDTNTVATFFEEAKATLWPVLAPTLTLDTVLSRTDVIDVEGGLDGVLRQMAILTATCGSFTHQFSQSRIPRLVSPSAPSHRRAGLRFQNAEEVQTLNDVGVFSTLIGGQQPFVSLTSQLVDASLRRRIQTQFRQPLRDVRQSATRSRISSMTVLMGEVEMPADSMNESPIFTGCCRSPQCRRW